MMAAESENHNLKWPKIFSEMDRNSSDLAASVCLFKQKMTLFIEEKEIIDSQKQARKVLKRNWR